MRIDREIPTTSGTNTYTVSFNPVWTTYSTNQIWYIIFSNANTGASTLNVNSLGAKSIKKAGNVDLLANDIKPNEVTQITYDGTNFQLMEISMISATSSTINTGSDNTYYISATGLDGSKYMSQYGNKTYTVASGTNTYTASLTPPITSLSTGCILRVNFTNGNTGTSSLNVDGLGAKPLVKSYASTIGLTGWGTSSISGDIQPGSTHMISYDGNNWVITSSSEVLRSIVFFSPNQVTSGTAFTLSLVTNDRVVRTLSGTNVTNTSYTEIGLPADFLYFPNNAYRIDSNRSNSGCDIRLTFGKGGVADSTINNLSVVATSATSTWGTKYATPGSSYKAGDRILITMVTTTSGNTTTVVGNVVLCYIGR